MSKGEKCLTLIICCWFVKGKVFLLHISDYETILHVSRDVTDIADILPDEPMHLVSAFVRCNSLVHIVLSIVLSCSFITFCLSFAKK
jgi:hypothetical protein